MAASSLLAAGAFAAPPALISRGVQVVPNPASTRVDITIDGQPFTSYIWPTTLKKPVLYPILDSDGVTLTRNFPQKAGERVDHPHHVGLWFNYARVNNFDFWNNSDAIKPANRAKMGSIVFDKLLSAKSGAKQGELTTLSTWIDGNDHPILEETSQFVFSGSKGVRIVDRIATLKALDHVTFQDEKDGMLGLRVASWLESPTAGGGIYTDSHGVETKTASASPDATGEYLTSEGVKGDAVWSTRGRWCSLTGHKDGHTVTIAIFDQPKNPGYPTTWHARGYGLFAANPLGLSVFNTKEKPINFTLEKGQSATFRYRIVIYTHAATTDELNHEADAFAAAYK
jgi:hypothetical protein